MFRGESKDFIFNVYIDRFQFYIFLVHFLSRLSNLSIGFLNRTLMLFSRSDCFKYNEVEGTIAIVVMEAVDLDRVFVEGDVEIVK